VSALSRKTDRGPGNSKTNYEVQPLLNFVMLWQRKSELAEASHGGHQIGERMHV